jgi:serine/threonine protein kinase
MELYCTHPSCPKPQNVFPSLDDPETLKTVKQQFCMSCGMPLILEGRYLTTKILGEGGFGTAYLGRDRLTPKMRQCAIKQFKPSMAMTPQQLTVARDLFHREAEILEQIGSEHPQIPNLFAFFDLPAPNIATGVDERFFYLVQEFVEGENLQQEMLRRGRFSEADIIEILTEMLNILEFIHSHNVIHRDIKPANIMRHTNGRLYLLDFGAIKDITKSDPTVIIYSLGYAPPEQMLGRQVFFSSDLYALAATCVFLLTNEKYSNLFDEVHGWQWEKYTQISDHITAVLNKMLQNAPHDRFQSVAEVRKALISNQSIPLQKKIPPSPTPPISIPKHRLPFHRLPLPEYIGQMGFIGWQTSLIGIISNQLSLPTFIPVVLTVVTLVYFQSQRPLNKITMIGVAAVSGLVALVLVKLDFVSFTATAIGGTIAVIATAILFRLVYRILSSLN